MKQKTVMTLARLTTVASAIKQLGEKDEEVKIFKKLLSVFGKEAHITNYQLAIVLIRAANMIANGGKIWEPDWNNPDEVKYSLWFIMGGSSGFRYYDCDLWYSISRVGSRLCFKDADTGKHIVGKFLPVFKKFMTIKRKK